MSDKSSDNEEEILIFAEFEDGTNIEKYRAVHVLGLVENKPIIQMDETFFTGKFKDSLGTYMFFEEDPTPKTEDSLFDKLPDKNLKYAFKTQKSLAMKSTHVTPKESSLKKNKPELVDDDIEIIEFKTINEALDKFKQEFDKRDQSVSHE